MFCLTKKAVQAIPLISFLTLCFFSAPQFAQSVDEIKRFSEITKQVKELKKSDLVQSLRKLQSLKNQFDSLTIEQSLLYYKLLAEIEIQQNKLTLAKQTANKGLKISKSLASPNIYISELLYLKGFALESLGDLTQASIEYKKGLEVAESLFDKVKIASGLIKLGTIAYLSDDLERALILLNDAYNIAGQTDDEELKGIANTELGIVYAYLEQDEQSMAYYQKSYLHFKKSGLLLSAHNSLNKIALTHINNKNYQQAIRVFKRIISESTTDTTSESLFTAYSGLASAHWKKSDNDPEAAYQYLLMAKDFLQSTENNDYKLQFYIDKANVLYELKRFDYALISISKVEKLFKQNKKMSLAKKRNYIDIINLKAKVFYQQQAFKKAYETKYQVISLTESLYENEDDRSITQVRLKLEAERADKESKVLYNQKVLYEASLREANIENETQKGYLIISALVALAFAWVLLKLVQSQHRLRIASNTDPLTGLANRRSLMQKAKDSFKHAKAKKKPLSIIMIDVDHFKKINDSLGHKVGDQVLTHIATLGLGMMRKSDLLGRFGGEEFMICLPGTKGQSALEIGERIRSRISEYHWNITHLEKVTVSIGVASFEHDADILTLIKRADEQLYHAKASGRNKVCG